MKRKIFLLALLCGIGSASLYGASDELLKNNLFTPDAAGALPSWQLRGNSAAVKPVPGGVAITANADGKPTYLLQMLPLHANGRYRASWKERGDEHNQYQLYVEWTTGSGKATVFQGANSQKMQAETTEKTRDFEFDYPAGANPGYLALTVRNGSVTITDLTLREVASPTPFASNFANPRKSWKFSGNAKIARSDAFAGPALILEGQGARAECAEIVLQPGKTYRLGYLVRAIGRGNDIGTQPVRVTPLSPELGWTDTWSDNIQYKETEFVAPAGNAPITLCCEIRGNGGAVFDKITITEAKTRKEELSVILTEPSYRNDIFASMPAERISGQAICRIPANAIAVELDDPSGKPIQSANGRGGTLSFSLPANQLPQGNYTLKASATSADGKTVSEQKTTIRILPHREYETVITPNQTTEINGTFFFPIMTWTLLRKGEPSDWIGPMLYHCARHGINSLTVFMDDPKLPEILDEAERYGMKAVIEMNMPKDQDGEEMRKWRRDVARILTPELLSKKALLGYLSVDEPCWGGKSAASTLKIYEELKALDPYRPVWINEAPRNEIASLAPYADGCDIYGCDIYPVPHGCGHSALTNQDLTCVGDYTRRMRTVINDRKPVWMVLQAFAWGSLFGKERRFPSLAEMRFMTYDSLVAGGGAATFWGLDSIDLPEFWDRFFELTTELHRISGIQGVPEVRNAARCDNPNIAFLVRQNEKGTFLLAVNRDKQATDAAFTLTKPVSQPFVSEFDGRKIPGSDHGFRDRIEGYGVRLYVSGPLPPPSRQLPPVDPAMEAKPFPGKIRAEKGNRRYSGEKYTGKAIWIWGPDLKDGSVCTLRRRFELDSAPVSGTAYAVCDDQFILKINDREVPMENQGWGTGNKIDLTPLLKKGENTVEAACRNGTGPCGFLFDLTEKTQSGKTVSLVSDASWEYVESGKTAGPAQIIAPYGSGAWGTGVFFFTCKH